MWWVPFALGFGTIALGLFSSGCKNSEESTSSSSPSKKLPDSFSCTANGEDSIPIADPRLEFCNLHNLMGGKCHFDETGFKVDAELPQDNVRNFLLNQSNNFSPILLRWDISSEQNFARFPKNGVSRDFSQLDYSDQLYQLKGLSIYLAGGKPCKIDTSQDIYNLADAHAFLDEYRRSPSYSAAFEKGKLFCVLRSFGGFGFSGKKSKNGSTCFAVNSN